MLSTESKCDVAHYQSLHFDYTLELSLVLEPPFEGPFADMVLLRNSGAGVVHEVKKKKRGTGAYR
jgi:hypothetical protein